MSQSQIYRVERRTKTVGKIYHTVKMADELNREKRKLSEADFHDKMLQLRYQFDSLLGEVGDARDQAFLKSGMLHAGLSPLPKPERDLDSRVALPPKDDEFDWNAVPRLPALTAAPEPGIPRLGWPTTIVLKDGRQLVLHTGLPEPPR